MKKKVSFRILSVVIALAIIFTSVSFSFAETNTESVCPLEVYIESNKTSYSVLDIPWFTVHIENISDKPVKNIGGEFILNGLDGVAPGTLLSFDDFELASGGTAYFDVFGVLNPSEADVHVNIFFRIILKIMKFFLGEKVATEYDFDDGRSLVTSSIDIEIAGATLTQSVEIWYQPNDYTVNDPSEDCLLQVNSVNSSVKDVQVGYYQDATFTAEIETLDENVSVLDAYVIDEDGNEIGYLSDNGMNGDDIAGDGVYSGAVEYYSTDVANIKYYVKAVDSNYNSTVSEDFVEICYFSEIPDEEFEEVKDINEYLEEMKEDMLNSGKSENEILNAAYNYLLNQGIVDDVDKNNESVKFVTESKIHVVFNIEEEGYKGRSQVDSDEIAQIVECPEVETVSTSSVSTAAYSNYPVPDEKSILVLRPYYGFQSDFGTSYVEVAEDIADEFGYTVNDVTGTDVTLETLKTFEDYGVILVDSHGFLDTDYADYRSDICLTQEFDSSIHASDYQSERIIVFTNDRIAVAPTFFDRYYRDEKMQNTLVYLGICHGLETTSLSNSLINAGAKSVIGYDDSVAFTRDEAMIEDIFSKMIEVDPVDGNHSVTVSDACDFAIAQNPGYPALILRGSEDYRNLVLDLNPAFIGDANLGFENNKLYWDGYGDFRIINSCGTLYPTEGKKMAIIGTGLGAVSDSKSSLYRTFYNVENNSYISFNYDVVSEEPHEFVGSQYNDTFVVNVYYNTADGGSGSYTTLTESVNSSAWAPLGGNYFAGGDNTTYHTGWNTCYVEIPEGATDVTVELVIWDLGDSIYDTATLVDNFAIVA